MQQGDRDDRRGRTCAEREDRRGEPDPAGAALVHREAERNVGAADGDSVPAAAAVIRVLRGRRKVASFSFRFRTAVFGRPRAVTWVVPRSLKPGTVQACLTAADLSGNHSRVSCAPVKVL